MTATLSPAEANAHRAELARLRRLRELETQRIERAWAGTPPFYCSLPECDGLEHDGYPYRHARTVQRPPPGDWFAWWLRGGRGAGKLEPGRSGSKSRPAAIPAPAVLSSAQPRRTSASQW